MRNSAETSTGISARLDLDRPQPGTDLPAALLTAASSLISESQNPQLLEVRFRATLGQEPEIELMLV
jgi:hypothetical protein